MVGARLGDAGGNRADTHLGDQLDRDVGFLIGVFQVENELREILNRIDVMVRRRRDEAHSGR